MSLVSDIQLSQRSTSVTQYDVVVVGAGPYGLAATAYLRAKGLNVATFGKVLELWRNHMPPRMLLRSQWWATSLADPQQKYSIQNFFEQSSQYNACYPLPLEAFVDYGMWFQKHAVPNVDETYVTSVEHKDKQFVVTLEDGRVVHSSVVVMAIGVYYYSNRPEEYSGLPEELVSHAFDHKDFSRFADKKVVLIGGGQSAVEYSALLHELGANVELVSRRQVSWLEPDRSSERTFLEKIQAPDATIAPGWNNWMLDKTPYLFYRLSRARKDRALKTYYKAAASDWLRERVIGKVNMREKQKVTKLREVDNGVEVTYAHGEVSTVDHVMLSTGYKVDIKHLHMLHPTLLAQIQADEGNSPVLNHYFESSVPGLYFTGLSTVRSFGPLYRFVGGNQACVSRLTQSISRKLARVRK